MELASWDGVRQAVRAGVGYTITSRASVRKDLEERELRLIDVPSYHDVQAVYLVASVPRAGQRTETLIELISCLKSELPEAL
jgi:DNA-binding transcriptional LysR family regulator